ncbi:MAG: aspartate/glutamate racemase family protein [Nitratireductor sp.]|nr:aspartate/glutamate racemase family protein [Nitratireductor sp.]
MKKIGIVGGVGWPATAAYYAGLCEAARAHCPGGSPPMMVESLDMRETLGARGEPGRAESWRTFDGLFRDALNRLDAGGCAIAAIASATPHARLSSIMRGTAIPVVSILDAAAAALRGQTEKQALVLGTAVTTQNGLFDAPLRAIGLTPIGPPSEADVAGLSALLNAYFYTARAREGRGPLIDYCRQRIGEPARSIVVLGCTDLAPAFPERAGAVVFEADGITFVDTMAAHVQAILAAALP